MPKWPLCLNTCTIQPASLMDKIGIAVETGYTAIEVWSNELTQFEQTGRPLSDLGQILEDSGLKVLSVIAIFDWMQSGDFHKKKTYTEARRRLRQAAVIGAPYIIASPVPDRQTLDITLGATRYRELLEMGEEVGVRPVMEFLGFNGNVYQLEQAVESWRDMPDGTPDGHSLCRLIESFPEEAPCSTTPSKP